MRRAVAVFSPLWPRNPSGQRKTSHKRRMRLAGTTGIPPALPWEKPPSLAQTVHTAGTATNRQEQIRARCVGQRCSASSKTAFRAPSVALGSPNERRWSRQSWSCRFQPLRSGWTVAPEHHCVRACEAAAHSISHR